MCKGQAKLNPESYLSYYLWLKYLCLINRYSFCAYLINSYETVFTEPLTRYPV